MWIAVMVAVGWAICSWRRWKGNPDGRGGSWKRWGERVCSFPRGQESIFGQTVMDGCDELPARSGDERLGAYAFSHRSVRPEDDDTRVIRALGDAETQHAALFFVAMPRTRSHRSPQGSSRRR